MAKAVPVPLPTDKERERFWRYVEKREDGCWVWIGAKFSAGYGAFGFRGQARRAHRVLYVWTYGELSLGTDQLDHVCDNRACVNPAHLRPSSVSENVLRGRGVTAENAVKTHCARGHEFTEENTYVDPRGWRQCRTCSRAAVRRYQASRPPC